MPTERHTPILARSSQMTAAARQDVSLSGPDSRLPRIPDWHELCAAFRGVTGHNPADHLITRWAQALAHLHRTRRVIPERAAEVDRRRDDVVALIDNWVSTHIQPRCGTERMGPAVDALAAAYVDAELTLAAAEHASEPAVHEAWIHVSALAVGWADLITEVVDGQPPPPRPTGRATPKHP
ncbi:hypothetical protein [Nocardia gamkensis]|uniref:DUF4254 domain-containing protein n=1 Tax=Nocardia gamkensis TaxID=352869 RepID=A0A7X6LBE4_9NOCA|nr:hypothetical protein [Nocardia gamkensis]NKY31409.1 DUF4254 domain-containing protein [Nocardia gamkensis]NQE72491.1 hypothetical protein [Nocardia gamkensis]